jgi:hypothetical protein
MAENSNVSSTGGIGFAGLLAILFIGLKLTGVINWSWYWVLSPIWMPFAVAIALVAIFFVFFLIKELFWGGK